MLNISYSEPSVIGGLLMFPEKSVSAYEKLSAEMFSSEVLSKLFQACKTLHKQDKPVDAVTVEGMVGNRYRKAIMKCCEIMPSSSGIDVYINIVRENWRKRVLIKQIQELAFDSQSEDMSSDELVKKLEAMVQFQRKIQQAITDETAKDFMDCAVEYFDELQRPDTALKTGWKDFDYLTGGLQRQGVYVIAANSGKGKTDLALNVALTLSKHYKVNYNTMEMPRKQLMRRIVSRATRINSARLRDKKNLTPEEYHSIIAAIDIMKNKTQLILDEQQGIDAETVEQKILKYQPDILFLDHLGLMNHNTKYKNQWEAIGETTKYLKQLALKYNLVIVELAQLNREAENRKGAPKMNEIKGSSTIENDADGIFSISVEMSDSILSGKDYQKAEVYVIKNRHGGTGKLEFNWMPQYHYWVAIDRLREEGNTI